MKVLLFVVFKSFFLFIFKMVRLIWNSILGFLIKNMFKILKVKMRGIELI